MTETLFRALTSRVRTRWQFMSFRGTHGGEWRGIVDVLAIRKNTSVPTHAALNAGDLFDIVLVQIKGGSARRPCAADLARLEAVADWYHAKAIVLFEWKRGRESARGRSCKWFRLVDREWEPAAADDIFG